MAIGAAFMAFMGKCLQYLIDVTIIVFHYRVSDSLLELYSTHWDDFTCMECLTGTLNDRNVMPSCK